MKSRLTRVLLSGCGSRQNSRQCGALQGRDTQRASNRTRAKREGSKRVRRVLAARLAEDVAAWCGEEGEI